MGPGKPWWDSHPNSQKDLKMVGFGVDLTENNRMEKARTPMRRRVKVHSTPPKAFRRRSTLPLEATEEDWGSGIAAEKQSFGAAEARKGRGPGGGGLSNFFVSGPCGGVWTLDWEKIRHSSGPSARTRAQHRAASVHAARTKRHQRNESLEQCR
jgi:hypothetical protein